MYGHFLICVLFAFLLRLDCSVYAQADTVQDQVWKVPNGALVDLSQTYTAGNIVEFAWYKYTSTLYLDVKQNLVYLWITAFDPRTDQYSQLLSTNINMTRSGSVSWRIDIPDKVLAANAKYVLRFKLPSSIYVANKGELSSPGFLILKAAVVTTTTTTTTTPSIRPITLSTSSVRIEAISTTIPSTTTTSTTASSETSTESSSSTTSIKSSTNPTSSIPTQPTQAPSTSTTSAATTTDSPPPPSTGLSTGAKGGIGALAAALGIGTLAAIWFFFVRKGKKAEDAEPASDSGLVGYNDASELGGDGHKPNQEQQKFYPPAVGYNGANELPGNTYNPNQQQQQFYPQEPPPAAELASKHRWGRAELPDHSH